MNNEQKKRVLVADDELYVAHILEFMLTREGYDVLTTNNGRSALGLYTKERPDVVVTDNRMPGLDGVGLTREIRAYERQEGLGTIPIIMIAEGNRAVNEAQAMAAGVDVYVQKPFSPARLLEKIQEELRAAGQDTTA